MARPIGFCNFFYVPMFILSSAVGSLVAAAAGLIGKTCSNNLINLRGYFIGCAVAIFVLGCLPYFLITKTSCCGMDKGRGADKIALRLLLGLLFLAMIAVLIILAVKLPRKPGAAESPTRIAPPLTKNSLDQFPTWLRNTVLSKWDDSVPNCLARSVPCSALDTPYYSSFQILSTAPLTTLQFGCCMPPQSCNFTFVRPTYWISNQTSSLSGDCSRWNNDPDKLCFNCDSCKAGVIAHNSKSLKIVNNLVLGAIVMCAVYFLYFVCLCSIISKLEG
ncbi:unnamed protein product [Cuscuta epithymum]|uniref:Uncharacterized protein n=1 Tax=Cuscuta epithymum TaxID=186058 RepID=A0AAV0E791_9ASTE|nr:unnamed protein product [Cuscuta epithymum]